MDGGVLGLGYFSNPTSLGWDILNPTHGCSEKQLIGLRVFFIQLFTSITQKIITICTIQRIILISNNYFSKYHNKLNKFFFF
jgi:hypothetical protein